MAVLELSGEKVNIFPLSEDYAAVQDISIVATICTVWEDPRNKELWMLAGIPRGAFLWSTVRGVATMPEPDASGGCDN
jgi:hypothetical protein